MWLYMAGHVPSDITGGALLGDMIGEYFLATRDHTGIDHTGIDRTGIDQPSLHG